MHSGIAVDLVGQRVDEVDDALGHGVARGGLGAEQEGLGREVQAGIILQALVQVDDLQDVQQLALVLVQALYLHIEDGVGVQHHTLVLPGVGGKGQLVLMLDLLQTLKDRLVVGVGLQLFQLLRMGEIALAGQVTEQSVQTGIDLGHPAAVVDAVGDVLELVRASSGRRP